MPESTNEMANEINGLKTFNPVIEFSQFHFSFISGLINAAISEIRANKLTEWTMKLMNEAELTSQERQASQWIERVEIKAEWMTGAEAN